MIKTRTKMRTPPRSDRYVVRCSRGWSTWGRAMGAPAVMRLLVACAVVSCSGSVRAQSTLVVPDDFATIQAAVDAAQSGDTVSVRAGRYSEAIRIQKAISLHGEERTTTLIESPQADLDCIAVDLAAGAVSIESLTARGGRAGIWAWLSRGSELRVLDTTAIENEFGVVAQGLGRLYVGRSFFITDSGASAVLQDVTAVIEASELLSSDTGLLLVGRADVDLSRNTIALANQAVGVYTRDCGYTNAGASARFYGRVRGAENRIYGYLTHLCPDPSQGVWPEGFHEPGWTEAVSKAADALDRGVSLSAAGKLVEAIAAFEEGLQDLRAAPFALLEADLRANLASLRGIQGRLSEALEELSAAREVFLARAMGAEAAAVALNVGLLYERLQDYGRALAALADAGDFFAARGADVELARVDLGLGMVYRNVGRYDEALAALSRARDVFCVHGEGAEVAAVDGVRGDVYTKLGRYDEALEAYKAAGAAFAALGRDLDCAITRSNIGWTYIHLGEYGKALEELDAARETYVAMGMAIDAAQDDLNRGAVYASLGRYAEAIASLTMAKDAFVAQARDVDAALAGLALGKVFAEAHMSADAQRAYAEARACFVEHGLLAETASCDLARGTLFARLHLCAEAVVAYEQGLAVLDRVPASEGVAYSEPDTRWRVLYNKGQCLERLAQRDEAISSYRDAIAVIESMRSHLRTEETKLAFGELTRNVYERLIDLLYADQEWNEAFSFAERCRARTFLESLFQGGIAPGDLQRADEGVVLGAVDPAAIDAAVAQGAASLRDNEAVLEYFVTDYAVYLWVVVHGQIWPPIHIDYDRGSLIQDILVMRMGLEGADGHDIAVGRSLGDLYAQFVAPALALLPEGVDTLLIVPSGPLWYVPFAALPIQDGQSLWADPRCLIDKFAIAYLPSLASMRSLLGPEEKPSGLFLGLANPTLLSAEESAVLRCAEAKQYPNLEEATETFANCYTGNREAVYVRGEAQELTAYEQAAGREVVVYACHGKFDAEVPLQSKLLLAQRGGGDLPAEDPRVPDGDYHAWEVLLTDNRGTKLVILAACETLLPAIRDLQGTLAVLAGTDCSAVKLTVEQLKTITNGDEVVGLARAFLCSGAQSVLGTLWQAQPQAVGKMLEALCEAHRSGLSWAQALQQAQIELKSGPFAPPWFWAPYQLVGLWR